MRIKQMIGTLLCTTVALICAASTVFAASKTDNVVEENERDEAYQITFDGKSYSLPCAVSEFEKNGWELNGYDVDEDVPGLTYSEITLKKGDEKLCINILNDLSDATALKNCKVASITIDTDRLAFTTSKGIQIGMGIDVVKKAHSNETFETSYISNNGKTEAIRYKYITEDEQEDGLVLQKMFSHPNCENKMEYEFTDGKVDKIILEYYKMGELSRPYEGSVTYMDDYKKPSSLGTDLTSFNYSIDGKVYHFPTPVRELIKNGFKVQEGACVPGLNSRFFNLSKKGKNIYVSMKNDDPRFMDAKNTYLRYFDDSGSDQNMHITLPGNLTIGSSEQDLLKVCPKLKITGGGRKEEDGITYKKSVTDSLSEYTITGPSEDYLEITVKDKKIDSITLSRYSDWPK